MKNLLKAAPIVLCLLASAFGQQTVAITDGSASDSPLSFKGTITFGSLDAESDCAVIGHNNSARPIVAYVLRLDVRSPDGQYTSAPTTHDHFFKDASTLATMGWNPGQDISVKLDCANYGHIGTGTPSMVITPTFVQLDDGSIWGDSASASEVMFQRQEALTYLQSLASAADITQAIAQHPPLREADKRLRWERVVTWSYISDKKTLQDQTRELNSKLAAAQAHAAWVK